ncbi:MAG TPA: flagellar hook protein FlgE [Xanthobacteraceae bacterium]|nr:flagellar hook protein FlgE [Xanthobacteraceae bacterium]
MGIFDALTTAVSGLQAQSFALQNISGNIANSQTVGYKETDTAFDALVSQAALGEQTSGGVFASSVASNGVQGTIQNETVATDMAINGQGYFVVTQPTGNSGTNPQFSGVNDYTRRGDFQMDSNGYLVNGAGYYLMGIPVDPATGAPTASSPQVLQFNNDFLPAQATTSINYAANLPSAPPTGVLDPANFTATSNPLDAASGGTGTVIGQDATTFTNESLDGGSITAYDSLGNPVNVQLRWAETASSGGSNSWQLFYQTNTSAGPTQVAWQNVGTTFTFNSSGQLTSPTASSLNLAGLAVNGDTVGNVTLNYGANLTQFASTTGSVQVTGLTQNGFGAGSMQSLSVAQGQIVGSFSNGQTVALANVSLATFNGQDALQPLNGEAFAATPESGNPNFSGTGSVVGSSLEASNVDIATQFSQLIVAQQAYSANARVMTTANQMIQSLLQVIQ